MYYSCCNIGFKDGTPTMESGRDTYHVMDDKVCAPKSKLKVGDLVVIGSIGRPLLKMISAIDESLPDGVTLGGNIIGKANFFRPRKDTERDAVEAFGETDARSV